MNTKGDVKVYAVIIMTEPYYTINSVCELAVTAVTVHLSGPFRGSISTSSANVIAMRIERPHP